MSDHETIWIGEWRVDPRVRSLRRGQVEHRLEPKMLDVLLLLVEQQGRPVARVELERRVWSGAAVGTELLNRTVWKLRKVLGDDPGRPTYIETIPRVGYRLVAPVRRGVPEETPTPAPVRGPSRRLWIAAALVAVAGLAVGISIRRADPATDPPPLRRIVPLTATPGYEAAPALSPDGRFVAYQRYDPASAAPTWDVAVIEVATREVRMAAADPGAQEYGPVWSPRGDSLAFVRQGEASCAIMVQPVGGEARAAAACAPDQSHELAWDLDGSFVLASSGGGQTVGLVRLGRDGSGVVQLTSPPVGYDGDGRPRISADGTRLAFVRQRTEGVNDIYVADMADPGDPLRLTFDNRKVSGLSWAPDGASLTFSSTRGGDSRMWRVSLDGQGPFPVPMSGRNASRISVGEGVMVYEEYFGDSDVWAWDPATGSQESWGGSSRSEWAVAASPDGRRVAFLSDRTGAPEIWVTPLAGGDPVQLTHLDGAQVDPPRWSADGGSLVFAAAMDGHFDVFVVPSSGGPPRRVTREAGDERTPAFWGDRVVYSANRTGAQELWVVAPDGGPPRRLTSGGGWAARPGAEGVSLYFTRTDEAGLWRLRPGDERPEQVWADLHEADWANWTPAAQGILYFRAHGADAPRLERIDLSTGAAHTLAVVESEVPDRAGVARLADGRVLFSRVVRSESDLWLATVEGGR